MAGGGITTVRNIASGGVALIAAWSSWYHMAHLAARYGERPEVAYALPFSVDGMLIVTSIVMVDDKRRHSSVRPVARFAFVVGVIASVAANIAGADPTLGARGIAAWPPIALLLIVEMLARPPATAATAHAAATPTARQSIGLPMPAQVPAQGEVPLQGQVPAPPWRDVPPGSRLPRTVAQLPADVPPREPPQPVPDVAAAQQRSTLVRAPAGTCPPAPHDAEPARASVATNTVASTGGRVAGRHVHAADKPRTGADVPASAHGGAEATQGPVRADHVERGGQTKVPVPPELPPDRDATHVPAAPSSAEIGDSVEVPVPPQPRCDAEPEEDGGGAQLPMPAGHLTAATQRRQGPPAADPSSTGQSATPHVRRPTATTRRLARKIMQEEPHLTRTQVANRLGVSTRRLREVLAA
jgi:hypothetical protein